ncbi:nitrate reductase subunit alpha [Trueperella sp.]|uniref:nitrate reductase subunit alpha n=1 Tax=Trueperella sp. TaxID=2699835 RepID=UPI0026101340|nr:nitrate reductase subunit alpha [Trueperella sp.]
MTYKESASGVFALGSKLRRGDISPDARQIFFDGGREADRFYRDRWAYDKVVRSTHGVNCTGSCSWKVYVKDGIITWESQETDYPSTGAQMPEYEPRGCPRGAAYAWYEYSPTRIRYPYMRGELLKLYRAELATGKDPVEAWGAIVEDPDKALAYKSQRGRGGMVRVGWDEANELIAAAHVYTIKTYGPDRMAGFSVIPAMSMISYGAGSRFYELLGGTMLSFYDWYADLPPASPQVFGDQTDVPESGDWFNAQYLIMWGSNIPVTRTPDAHFMTEARYHGQKVVAISPDFADNTKFGDEWLRVNPGTDGALAQAMGHVILSEFHVGREEPYFLNYMKRFTDAPFLVKLDKREGSFVPGKFLTVADLPEPGELAEKDHPEHRGLVLNTAGEIVDPGGTIADRYSSVKGRWNLALDGVDPAITAASRSDAIGVEILLPRFDLPASETESVGGGVITRGVPAIKVADTYVTTVYDLLLAEYGVSREGLPGTWPAGYEDATVPGTPAWQEEHTGVPMNAAIRIGREFAQNAIDSDGRSMIVMGAGTNHFFHSDTIYRTFLALTTMCATQGKNGGGWAHYVGQEKVRPIAGWQQYAMALDWQRPARQMISTGFWYLLTDQWRYDGAKADAIGSPLADWKGLTNADTLIEASQRGWMPSFPQFDRSPLEIGQAAEEAGLTPGEYVVGELKADRLHFACTDPDNPVNFTRILANWRTNLMGSSAKGAEFFQRHMIGADNAVRAKELAPEDRPKLITWRDDPGVGKLDLMFTADFRNTSTTLYSDVVLPAATWYEKEDISSTDMHPFVHTFNEAVTPPWEARTDFEIFKTLAALVSQMAVKHLGTRRDVIMAPISHDTPDELALPHGVVAPLAERELIPGKTLPKFVPVERDYTEIYNKFVALGPLAEKLGLPIKGIALHPDEEIDKLAALNGISTKGAGAGRPLIDTAVKAADTVMHLAGATNGRLAVQGFKQYEEQTGQRLADLAEGAEEKLITFRDATIQPRSVITSPEWSGSEHGGRRYSAFVINIEHLKPFHTFTGRQHYYLDHDWMIAMGESLPVYRPPLDLARIYGDAVVGELSNEDGVAQVAVRYLTPHNKWSIHSQYFDNLNMLTLGRGGQTIWLSPQDADKIGVKDNDWVEAFNRNGAVAARAVVSHRMPEGTVYMHHAQERVAGTPISEVSGKRGGIHNSLTRILLKPTHMAGGHAQLTYGFNYIGPTGNQRDEVTLLRKRTQEVTF